MQIGKKHTENQWGEEGPLPSEKSLDGRIWECTLKPLAFWLIWNIFARAGKIALVQPFLTAVEIENEFRPSNCWCLARGFELFWSTLPSIDASWGAQPVQRREAVLAYSDTRVRRNAAYNAAGTGRQSFLDPFYGRLTYNEEYYHFLRIKRETGPAAEYWEWTDRRDIN